ncbi:hypothetical protein [Acinetobacter baumannii]|uniref:hypothetical protein n=1 Tax=Acinetobacter baumannii TaxID=470 RepID=UPI00046DDAF3|nr:hypothetical protein [Acinetobacter baumannii]MDC4749336.1 hypothetical protein [Acinetobacter baumannii]MDH2614782.1 hypothetical protein [Acinetobacter baumannii]MDH2618155.1 hypothetical protein [Acinetobacter baumannii]MDH2632622.1 hypothetical protein [Acinetobacter baumannii]TPT14831.1 hypothetical protein FJU71_15835 [Acinetobacter baumannii]
MVSEKNYRIFSYLVISLITLVFFELIEGFFDNLVELYKIDKSVSKSFVMILTNFWFQDLFKERIREACLINFLTYKLNFEISRFK